jgi:hypothetical protein
MNDVVSEPKLYRAHRCSKTHKSGLTFARCLWPNGTIYDDGEFAVISRCPGHFWPTVNLYADIESASNDRWLADEYCGEHCGHRHELVGLVLA